MGVIRGYIILYNLLERVYSVMCVLCVFVMTRIAVVVHSRHCFMSIWCSLLCLVPSRCMLCCRFATIEIFIVGKMSKMVCLLLEGSKETSLARIKGKK